MTAYDVWLESVMIGVSPEIRRLRHMITRVAKSPLSVLISGPTGVGKELVAEAIHRVSGRTGPLVAVNICAVAESMFESTLFGHVRGAFTGAVGETTGWIGEADGGTLFLDEIGALPMREQAKLLRVLETRRYRQIGAQRERTSDFRLLSATNEDIDEAVTLARFRDDLRHRLGKVVLRVPPLAERRTDIPLLVEHFVDATAQRDGTAIDEAGMRLLLEHPWPGNVRELKSVVANLVMLTDETRIGRREVLTVLGSSSAPLRPSERERSSVGRSSASDALRRMLEESRWDTRLVAAELGIHRVTVYRRMRALGITVPTEARHRAGHYDEPSAQTCANEP